MAPSPARPRNFSDFGRHLSKIHRQSLVADFQSPCSEPETRFEVGETGSQPLSSEWGGDNLRAKNFMPMGLGHVDRQPAPEDRIHILAAWLDRGEEQPRKD
jgi:hypothetical protein